MNKTAQLGGGPTLSKKQLGNNKVDLDPSNKEFGAHMEVTIKQWEN